VDTTIQTRMTIPARIDRLPLSREIWGIMLLAGVAWLVESYDVGVIGNVLPSLQKEFQLGALSVGLLAIASTLGIVISVIPAGWLADTIGRKKILITGTAWYAVFSLLCGFAPTPAALVVLRFVAGLGMGAIFPIPYAMAAELTPRHFRGAMTAILDSFLSVGYFAAPLIAFALIPRLPQDLGWRTLFYIGGFPLLFVPALLKWMPESPRWLEVKGRTREADAIVSRLEHDIERRTGGKLPPPQMEAKSVTGNLDSGAVVRTRPGSRYQQLLERPYLKRTVMMWVAFSCILFIFYAIQTYTPTVLIQQGYGNATAFLLTAIIVVASIPGKYAAAFAVERFGRKATLICFTGAAAGAAILFGVLHNPMLSLSCGIILAFFGIGVDPVIKIYGAEQYPTRIRETGIGLFEGVGRFFGGALAPFIMAFLLTGIGVAGSYLFVALLALVGIGAVALLGTETKGRTIEHASEIQRPGKANDLRKRPASNERSGQHV
jgi:MFS transporter, putative metabolite:H+ symporter